MELEKGKTSQRTRKHPRIMKKKDIRVRSSIAATVEPDMVQGSVWHMGKHVTIARNEITSRVCADHGNKSMDWA